MTTTPFIPPASVQALEALPASTADEIYRPFLQTKNTPEEPEWVNDLELDTVKEMAARNPTKLKILILYGSLRTR
jgi:hypothetical protein